MNPQIVEAHKFTEIEELHTRILPILDRPVEHLYKSESPLEFQSLTHQIIELINDYITMSVVMNARSLSPKNDAGQPILHYQSQRLLDRGYFTKTILGIRKITEEMADKTTLSVYSFPTLIEHLKATRTFLDIQGWMYLVSLSNYPDLKSRASSEKALIADDFASMTHIYQQVTAYRQKSKHGKTITHENGILCFLSDMNNLIKKISGRYKYRADKIYAHASDRQTWDSAQDLFVQSTIDNLSEDILLLSTIHHMLYMLIIGHDIEYTFTPMSYGLAEDFNLTPESVDIVHAHERQLCTQIRTVSQTAQHMLSDISKFKTFVDTHTT